MFQCPSCSRSFETRGGLGVHHSSVHDERLPNRTCARCGSEFYSDYSKKYCSDECLAEVSFEGENAPNYQGKKQTTECVLCGGAFEFYPSDKEGLYCPACVETEEWRDPPSLDGADNPHWSGGKREFECAVCADPVERYPSNATGEAILCSEVCRRAWLSEAFTGEGHPNWKGGGNGPYGEGWSAVRRAALERDGYECVRCGTDRDDLGRNPDVHHIVPVRYYIEAHGFDRTDAHTLENVVTLCPPCHRTADFGHVEPARLRGLIGTDPPARTPPAPAETA